MRGQSPTSPVVFGGVWDELTGFGRIWQDLAGNSGIAQKKILFDTSVMAALAFGAACVAANTLVYMRRRSRVNANDTRPPERDVLLHWAFRVIHW